jgi:hypothetical protein
MCLPPTFKTSLFWLCLCLPLIASSVVGQCTAPSFAPATNFAAGNGPYLTAVADFNGDGKLDLAVPNFDADQVSILLGNGMGGFTPAGSFAVGDGPTSVAAGDFNSDGNLDLAVTNWKTNTFGDLSVLLGSGNGSFGSASSFRLIANPNSVTVTDLNGDGKLDLVAATYSENLGNVKVLLGDGAGGFGTMKDFGGNGDGYSAVVADFNGDGEGDVAIAKGQTIEGFAGSNISVLLGNGTGTLGSPSNFTVGLVPVAIAVGDFNADGKLDIAAANVESDNVSILLGDGLGGFGAANHITVGDGSNAVAVGDFNGDNHPDLAVSNVNAGTLSILLGNGTGSFSTPTNFAVGTKPISVVTADFNGDGRKDLAIANFGSNNLSVLLNTCAGAPVNQIDDPSFFVRQHYQDFLNRTPDPSGLDFWTHQITDCGADQACSEVKRINVSAAFFISIEFQETGYLVYRIYKVAYGNLPGGAPVPVRFNELVPDTQQIGLGVVVGKAGWEQVLENNKQAFALDFVTRSRFTSAYPTTLTPAEFVDMLFANAGVTPTATERTAAINEFGGAGNTADTAARARALRRVAENSTFTQQEFNRAFVLMQYFGYLRRNPYDPPEATLDYSGYNFWLNKLNQFGGNYIAAEMVKAFITSGEYRGRFGP